MYDIMSIGMEEEEMGSCTTVKEGRLYSLAEEIANAITHGLGVIFGIVVTAYLVYKAAMDSNVLAIVGFAVYGCFLTLMYLSSTLYHAITHQKAKQILRVVDHCSIYLMIAGCYLPISLLALQGIERITIIATVFAIAVAGIVFKIVTYGKYDKYNKISVLIYVAMGWIVVFSLRSIYRATSLPFILWFAAGGIMYTIGTIFYKSKRIPFNHAIWHAFVLAGSVLQFVSILREYVL